MDPVFIAIEESALSRWATGRAFEAILVAHTLGVAFVAGPAIAVALRILGVARGAPLHTLRAFLPVVAVGLVAAVVSGGLLLAAYPTKALTNPVFYAKLAAIGLGLALLLRIRTRVMSPQTDEPARLPGGARAMAWASLALWTGAIVAGRLLAYTYTRLTAS